MASLILSDLSLNRRNHSPTHNNTQAATSSRSRVRDTWLSTLVDLEIYGCDFFIGFDLKICGFDLVKI
jgi:hypothetical protein